MYEVGGRRARSRGEPRRHARARSQRDTGREGTAHGNDVQLEQQVGTAPTERPHRLS